MGQPNFDYPSNNKNGVHITGSSVARFLRLYLPFILLILASIAFLIFMAIYNARPGYQEVSSTISYISPSKQVYVTYQVNGVIYENLLNGYNGELTIGKEVMIKYLISDPNQIVLVNSGFNALAYSLSSLILAVGIGGVVFNIFWAKRKAKKANA